MRSPCKLTFHRNLFLRPQISYRKGSLWAQKTESHMLESTLLKEVDGMCIKHLIPEKDGRKGREMTTLSERRMLIALDLHLLWNLQFPHTKKWKGLICEYSSLTCVHSQRQAVSSCCPFNNQETITAKVGNINIKVPGLWYFKVVLYFLVGFSPLGCLGDLSKFL